MYENFEDENRMGREQFRVLSLFVSIVVLIGLLFDWPFCVSAVLIYFILVSVVDEESETDPISRIFPTDEDIERREERRRAKRSDA